MFVFHFFAGLSTWCTWESPSFLLLPSTLLPWQHATIDGVVQPKIWLALRFKCLAAYGHFCICPISILVCHVQSARGFSHFFFAFYLAFYLFVCEWANGNEKRVFISGYIQNSYNLHALTSNNNNKSTLAKSRRQQESSELIAHFSSMRIFFGPMRRCCCWLFEN